MSEDTNLRQLARAAIQAGTLPNRHADRTWAGSSGGGCCCVCAEELRAGEVEFELEFLNDDQQRDAVGRYRLHVRCFAAWKLELQSRAIDERDLSDRGAPV